MQTRKKKKKEGVVDLNQAKLEEFEKARPSVAASQKVPSPKNTKETKNEGDASKMPTVNKKNEKIKPIGNVAKFKDKENSFFKHDENGRLLLTRRSLIYGAIGAGALIVAGSGVKMVTDTVNNTINSVNTLKVPKANVVPSDSFSQVENTFLNVSQEFTLPYGSLV